MFNANQREAPLEPSRGTPRILIIRAGAIGDTLMATPLVRALRQTCPNAHIAFLCSRTAQDVLRHNPHLDQVIPLAFRHLPIWLSTEKRRLLRQLRNSNLDWVLALESDPTFVDLACRSGARRVIAYGQRRGDGEFQRAPFDPAKHSSENHLRLAEPLGVGAAGLGMELYYPAELDVDIRNRLSSRGLKPGARRVGVHAGWGGRKHAPHRSRLRTWPSDRFAQLVRWLVENVGAEVVLTGSANDRPLNQIIAREAGVPCLNLAGELSLLELAALIHQLDLYVTIDSGPAHMAAALGTPLLTLWGPGIFEQTRPLAGKGPVQIIYERVHCAPCYGTPRKKSCQDNICMKQIEVGEVSTAVRNLLGI